MKVKKVQKIILGSLTNKDSCLVSNGLGAAEIVVQDPLEEDGFRMINGPAGGPFFEKEFRALIDCGQLVPEADSVFYFVLSQGPISAPETPAGIKQREAKK